MDWTGLDWTGLDWTSVEWTEWSEVDYLLYMYNTHRMIIDQLSHEPVPVRVVIIHPIIAILFNVSKIPVAPLNTRRKLNYFWKIRVQILRLHSIRQGITPPAN